METDGTPTLDASRGAEHEALCGVWHDACAALACADPVAISLRVVACANARYPKRQLPAL